MVDGATSNCFAISFTVSDRSRSNAITTTRSFSERAWGRPPTRPRARAASRRFVHLRARIRRAGFDERIWLQPDAAFGR
jgi:hypothetical protein